MSNDKSFYDPTGVLEPGFVTKKISKSVARIYHCSKEPIVLGNLSSKGLGICQRLCRGDVNDASKGFT